MRNIERCLFEAAVYKMSFMKKLLTENELLVRLERQCAMTEYAIADIKQKVYKAGLDGGAANRIANKLVEDGYVNEDRYIRAFVHDKFAFNRWGRRKIELALAQKGIRGERVEEELSAIDEELYESVLVELLRSKDKSIAANDNRQRVQKLLGFAVARGFEPYLAMRVISNMVGQNS